MKRKIFLLTALLLSMLFSSLQAQYKVTGCEKVTGLQTFWDPSVEVTNSGQFVNTGTVEFRQVTNLVNHGSFSDRPDYFDPCELVDKTSLTGTGSLNIFGTSADSTYLGGSLPARMYNVELNRNIGLGNEWQITGTLTWSGGLVNTDRANLSHFLHFMNGSSVTGEGAARHVDGYAAWSGNGDFTLPTGDGGKLGRVGLAGSCYNLFKAAYFNGDPGSATLPAGAPFSTSELGQGLCTVSDVEYWDVDGTAFVLTRSGAGCSNCPSVTSITLYFDAASGLADIATDTAELVVAGWDGMKWVNLGRAALSGTLASGGSVTSNPGVPDEYTALTFGVYDATAPAPDCQDVTIYLDSTGAALLTAATVDNGSTDNCAIDTLTLDITGFDCDDLSSSLPMLTGNTVTLTVTDVHNNTATCTASVTVLDTIKPTAICQGVTTYLDATGNATITAAAVNSNSADACGIDTMTLSLASFDCDDLSSSLPMLNSNTVTLTVTDPSGNSGTCTASVTVLDTIKPTAICQDVTVSLNAGGNATVTAAAVDNNSEDTCDIANLSLSQTSFTTSDIGANTVTLTVSDPSGNTSSCTATVTVEDNAGPNAQCQNLTRLLNSQGNRIVTPAEVDDNSTDPSGIASLALSQTVFNCSHLGPNAVTLTVTDVSGNSSTCSATITIMDNTPPKAVCKNATLALNAAGLASLPALAVNNGSTDECGISAMNLSQPNFSCIHVGSNTVSLTVTDAGGNTNTCSATVTVTDLSPPAALCQPATLQLGANGTATIAVSTINNNSADACGIGSLSLSQAAFTCAHLGINPVTLTVTDANGNTASCQTAITVVDQLLPKAQCKNATAYLDANGQASISVSLVNNASSDNCGIAGLNLSNSSFDCSNIGPNTVTLTVTDASGNSKSCIATVTVVDNLVSGLVCKNITLPVTGGTTIQPAQVFDAAASSDNCGTLIPLSVTPNLFYCINDGPNLVTLTVSDSHGATATCQATVTVQGPIITAVTTPTNCNELNGTMVVTAQNFVGQPGYSIDNGVIYQFTNTFDNLQAGIYPLVVNFFGADNCTTPPIYVEVVENKLTNTWTGAGDGIHWTSFLNWSLLLAPADCHHVVIPGEKVVLLRDGEVGYGYTLDVQNGGMLTVEPAAVLNIKQ